MIGRKNGVDRGTLIHANLPQISLARSYRLLKLQCKYSSIEK